MKKKIDLKDKLTMDEFLNLFDLSKEKFDKISIDDMVNVRLLTIKTYKYQ